MHVFSWEQITQNTFSLLDFFSQKKEDTIETAITIGGFDGPHKGHRGLFDAVLSQKECLKGVVTFTYSPRAHKTPHNFHGNVSTLRLRLQQFKNAHFDFTVVIDFSAKFSTIKGLDFLNVLKNKLHMRFLAVGHGFKCGFNQDTDEQTIVDFAKNNNVSFVSLPLITQNGMQISSTLIRHSIRLGDLQKTKDLLGFAYRLDVSGIIIKEKDGFICKTKKISQVIPPVGQYTVCVETVNPQGTQYIDGVLYSQAENLRLEVLGIQSAESIQTIIFGNPEG